MQNERNVLNNLVHTFQVANLYYEKITSQTAIQGIVVPGNEEVKHIALNLQQHDLDVRPILYPTVPKGKERLRIVLHAFNTEQEVNQLIKLLQ